MRIRRTRRVSEPPNTHYTRKAGDRRWRDRVHWPSVISAVCVLLIAMIAVYVVLQDSPARGAADRAAVVAEPTAVPGPPVLPSRKTPEYSPPIGDRIESDGQWIVGKQVSPGVYRSAAGPKCYWERLAGLSGAYTDLIANGGYRKGPQLVEIKRTDFVFTSQNCAPWQLVMDR